MFWWFVDGFSHQHLGFMTGFIGKDGKIESESHGNLMEKVNLTVNRWAYGIPSYSMGLVNQHISIRRHHLPWRSWTHTPSGAHFWCLETLWEPIRLPQRLFNHVSLRNSRYHWKFTILNYVCLKHPVSFLFPSAPQPFSLPRAKIQETMTVETMQVLILLLGSPVAWVLASYGCVFEHGWTWAIPPSGHNWIYLNGRKDESSSDAMGCIHILHHC